MAQSRKRRSNGAHSIQWLCQFGVQPPVILQWFGVSLVRKSEALLFTGAVRAGRGIRDRRRQYSLPAKWRKRRKFVLRPQPSLR